MGNKVKIIQEGYGKTKIFIDDIEVKNVQYIDYNANVNEVPMITLRFIPETLNYDEIQRINKNIEKLIDEKGVYLEWVMYQLN